jgi:quercetin dioxygenase-like cupin family protein
VSEISIASGVNLGQGQGKAFWLLADRLTFKATAADTSGAYTVVEVDAAPNVGPPPHIHRDADESFYVLEGTFDFMLGDEAFSAGPGSFVHLPKGIVHVHKAGGGAAAKALVIQSPAGVERFVEELGVAIVDASTLPEPREPERIVGVARRHGIEVPGA